MDNNNEENSEISVYQVFLLWFRNSSFKRSTFPTVCSSCPGFLWRKPQSQLVWL